MNIFILFISCRRKFFTSRIVVNLLFEIPAGSRMHYRFNKSYFSTELKS